MNPQELADQLAQLQIEFPALDSSLVAAILNDTSSSTKARETLALLAPETWIDDNDENNSPEWSISDETDPTTYSLSSWHIEDDIEDSISMGGAEGDAAAVLAVMFPSLTSFTIKNILNKYDGNIRRATDELLNRVYLAGDPEAEVVRGVDGFDAGLLNGAKGKKKGRKGRRNGKAAATTENDPPGQQIRLTTGPASSGVNDTPSRWEEMASEISYISTVLGLPERTVKAAYHRHSSALGPTIMALLDANSPSGAVRDPTHVAQLQELSAEFGSSVRRQHLEALLHLCKENTPAVFKLAGVLGREPKPTITIVTAIPAPVPAPPKTTRPAASTTNGWVVVGGGGPSSSSSSSTPISPPVSPRFQTPSPRFQTPSPRFQTPSPRFQTPSPRFQTPSSPLQDLSMQTAARNEAFSKASASYRKSRSDPLMGGAAAFYSNVGHHHNATVKSLRDRAAEELVASNSTLNSLDLHGATVSQGVRFARERTTDWWVRQRREQELAGGGRRREVTPFHIVCGAGRHSRDGVPQLLPAVSRMLLNEGWRVVCESGKIVVMGVSGARARMKSF